MFTHWYYIWYVLYMRLTFIRWTPLTAETHTHTHLVRYTQIIIPFSIVFSTTCWIVGVPPTVFLVKEDICRNVFCAAWLCRQWNWKWRRFAILTESKYILKHTVSVFFQILHCLSCLLVAYCGAQAWGCRALFSGRSSCAAASCTYRQKQPTIV